MTADTVDRKIRRLIHDQYAYAYGVTPLRDRVEPDIWCLVCDGDGCPTCQFTGDRQ